VDENPDVQSVLDFHVSTHPRRRPSATAAKSVRKALKLGYSVSDLRDAITGNALDKWHRSIHKHALSYVLRNEEKIDEFREKTAAAPPPETRQLVHDGVLTEFGDHASRPDLRSVV
jgi:hypothetical protein